MDRNDYYAGFSAKAIRERYQKLRADFRAAAGGEAELYFSSPGRAEIIGNHTDHNLGKVIVSAITCDIACAVKPRKDGVVAIFSDAFAPIRVSVSDVRARPYEKGKSRSLVRGVLARMNELGYRTGGFIAFTQSTIFRGAGVSSSAAFEVLVAEIENVLYAGGALAPSQKALIGQYAENVYFGKPCGLLDQTGIALGGMNAVDFACPASPAVTRLSPPKGYTIVITNTGGSHSALTGHYAAIRREMGEVAALFHKKYLRDIEYDELLASADKVKNKVSDRAFLRAMHFFEENERVDKAAAALQTGDTSVFLEQIERSGVSSLCFLQNGFVPGSETQPIPLALSLANRYMKDGASRLHGGGFAGTVLSYVADGEADSFAAKMKKVFGKDNVFSARTRNIGAGVIDADAL